MSEDGIPGLAGVTRSRGEEQVEDWIDAGKRTQIQALRRIMAEEAGFLVLPGPGRSRIPGLSWSWKKPDSWSFLVIPAPGRAILLLGGLSCSWEGYPALGVLPLPYTLLLPCPGYTTVTVRAATVTSGQQQ